MNVKSHHHSRNLWFKISVFCGIALGIGLLTQTFVSYRYVSKILIREEADRELARDAGALGKAVESTDVRDQALLSEITEEVRQELPQIAWINLLDVNGKPLARSGTVAASIYSPQALRAALGQPEGLSAVISTGRGPVLLRARPLRPPVPQDHASNSFASQIPPPQLVAEIAIYLDGVAAPFGRLRLNSLVECLSALALVIAMCIMSLRFREYVVGMRLSKELALAHRVQQELLPETNSVPGISDFAGECISAWQVGGDFYDLFAVGPDQTALVLGDVAGKGMSAALLMSLVQGTVRAASWQPMFTGERVAPQVNEFLCRRTSGDRFISLFWGLYDADQSVLRYVNAGHLPPMLVTRNDSEEFEVRRLEKGGPVLGLLPGAAYQEGKAVVRSGDLFVMFSDGITEAENSEAEQFGDERVFEVIRSNWHKSARDIRDAVLREVQTFLGDLQPQDDQTLVIVRLQTQADYRAVSQRPREIMKKYSAMAAGLASPSSRPSLFAFASATTEQESLGGNP
jgi:hypothetical protein